MPEMTRPTSAGRELADLICADPALLQAEFESIVAANFPTPPPGDRLPPGASGAPRRVPVDPARPGVAPRDAGVTPRAISTLRRQRSPPGPVVAPIPSGQSGTTKGR
jgi:hypothetical protein